MFASAWFSASMCSRAILRELVEAQVGELDVPAHPEIRAVELQDEARPRHRLVLVAHRLGDREEIGLVARVVIVAEEQRDHARRGGAT